VKFYKETKMKLVRTDEAIDDQIGELFAMIDQGKSRYPGMTYEEGAIAMYDWLCGNLEDKPMEDE
jgi:hypothetical protein